MSDHRSSRRTNAGPRVRQHRSRARQRPCSHGPTRRYPHAWQQPAVEAVVPAGVRTAPVAAPRNAAFALDAVVFDQHAHMGASYKYTECLSNAQTGRHRQFKAGAALNVLDWDGLNGQVRPLIEDPQGISAIRTSRLTAGAVCSPGRNRTLAMISTSTKSRSMAA